MAGRSVACVDRKVNTHTHSHPWVHRLKAYADPHRSRLEGLLCVHGCSCLFTSDNSCPAYAALPSVHYDSSFGGMVCHFLSSVHRTSVITGARARLFYRTLYEGRRDDCTARFSVSSLFWPIPIVSSLISTSFPLLSL